MINAQADLRLTLRASVYFEQFEALPEREQITLTRLYAAAAYHCYGGLR